MNDELKQLIIEELKTTGKFPSQLMVVPNFGRCMMSITSQTNEFVCNISFFPTNGESSHLEVYKDNTNNLETFVNTVIYRLKNLQMFVMKNEVGMVILQAEYENDKMKRDKDGLKQRLFTELFKK